MPSWERAELARIPIVDYIGVMQRTAVIATLKRHKAELNKLGIVRLSLFGSTARDEASRKSDVDLAVTLTPKRVWKQRCQQTGR